MTSNEISNKQIKQFFDSYIKGKKDVYFLISTGTFYAQRLDPYHPKSEDYIGEKKFLDILENVFDENPYQIGISLYEKAVKVLKSEPFYHKNFVLHKENTEVENQTSGLKGIGLDGFGGIEGILDSKLNVKYLSGENENLKKSLEKLTADNEKGSEKLSEYSEKLSEIKEELKTKNWEINSLKEEHRRIILNIEDDHKRELERGERNNDRFEKVLTIGGLVAAKAAGLNESDLRGLLGIDSNQVKSIENLEQKGDIPDIDFKEQKNYTGKKAEANNFILTINKILSEILDSNEEENAFKIIASFYNIIGFANSDIKNLNYLNQLVVSEYKNENMRNVEKTDIEKEIEKINN